MLIYNEKLSVSPLTTHIPLKKVVKKINKSLIIKKVELLNKFYNQKLKVKPKNSCGQYVYLFIRG